LSALTVLTKIQATHAPHRPDPSNDCDVCRLLDMVERQREAMQRVIEGFTKSQVDPLGMSKVLQSGLGR
jgi:hypothetical protein